MKLKPCPKCGFSPDILVLTDSDQRIYGYIVQCCGKKTRLMNRRKNSIAAWNTRTPEPPQ